MSCIFTSLNPILGCIWTHLIGRFLYISGGTLNGGYGNSCKVLKQPFHLAFLLTCICSRNWFSLLCPFFSALHLGLHVSGCLRRLSMQKAVSGHRHVVSVESVRLKPRGLLSYGSIYRKRVSRAPGWSCYIPPLNTVCLHVNLPVCPTVCLSASIACM